MTDRLAIPRNTGTSNMCHQAQIFNDRRYEPLYQPGKQIARPPNDENQRQSLPPTPPETVKSWPHCHGPLSTAEGSDESERSHQTLSSDSTRTGEHSESYTLLTSSETCKRSREEEIKPHILSWSSDTEALGRSDNNCELQLAEIPEHFIIGNLHRVGSEKALQLHPFPATVTREEKLEENRLEDDMWKQSPSYKDFHEDPAHEFWKWDQMRLQWFHQDKETGSFIWCPTELD